LTLMEQDLAAMMEMQMMMAQHWGPDCVMVHWRVLLTLMVEDWAAPKELQIQMVHWRVLPTWMVQDLAALKEMQIQMAQH